MNKIKIAYFGTGEFSAKILEDILKDDFFDVKLVVSQADKKVGREQVLTATPVHKLALEKELEILQPEKLRENTEVFDKLKSLDLDFIIVVAYGKIIPNEILAIPRNFVVNIHGSILPLYRGASPIQESVKNGDIKTGLTIMKMSQGMDEGDILSIKEIDIDVMDKTQDIFNKFSEIGVELLSTTLKKYIAGEIIGVKQDDSEATYCSKISKEDGKIDFAKSTAKEIYDMWRSYSTWPGIYTYFKGKKLDITDCFFDEHEVFLDEDFKLGDVIELEDHGEKSVGIICKSGILLLNKIKLEGKKEMDIFSFVNGYKDFLDYNFN
ncbi:MAG: methionyl-tRNA formyltransferase [Candidatus Gracilibacteria bacterium]|nr:methionyl-tRNA formyltransferase [Candidatus Gracilibacteria bacterium]